MACKEYKNLVMGLIDDPDVKPPKSWERHASSCASCGRDLSRIKLQRSVDLDLKNSFKQFRKDLSRQRTPAFNMNELLQQVKKNTSVDHEKPGIFWQSLRIKMPLKFAIYSLSLVFMTGVGWFWLTDSMLFQKASVPKPGDDRVASLDIKEDIARKKKVVSMPAPSSLSRQKRLTRERDSEELNNIPGKKSLLRTGSRLQMSKDSPKTPAPLEIIEKEPVEKKKKEKSADSFIKTGQQDEVRKIKATKAGAGQGKAPGVHKKESQDELRKKAKALWAKLDKDPGNKEVQKKLKKILEKLDDKKGLKSLASLVKKESRKKADAD